MFRRGLLCATALALVLMGAPGGAPRADVTPAPGSPRARLQGASTRGALHLFLYQTPGRFGQEYTAAQLATVARLYDMVTWVYAGSGVTQALRAAGRNMLVTQYNDLTWSGDYDQIPGVPWMPMDWEWIDGHENFFSHSSATKPWSEKNRIPNPFFGWDTGGRPIPFAGTPHEWQANPLDFDSEHPGNLDKWVNYFTARSKALIDQDAMDGLMIDEAMQPYSIPPDGYEPEAWHTAVKRALAFVRDQLGPDKVIFWNGIMQDALVLAPDAALAGGWARPRSLDYFESGDGALIECFVTCYLAPLPDVWPQALWEQIQDLSMEIARRGVLLAQSPTNRDDTRMYSLASFYIVKGDHSYYGRGMEWLPEYGVALGSPLLTGEHITDYLVAPGRDLGVAQATGTVYSRPYERGLALANPSKQAATVRLARRGYLVLPQGGGAIGGDGALPEGSVTYEPVDTVELPPQSGALVVWEAQ